MRDIPTSPRVKEIRRKRRKQRIRIIILVLVLFISFIWVLGYLSGDRHITISNINVSGTHIIDKDEVKNDIEGYMSGKYFYLFSKANAFIYPEKQIYNSLIKKYSRIETLSIKKVNIRTLQVDIIERIGSYLYCGSNIPENTTDIGENCYFINNDGYIFDTAPYFSGNVYFKYYLPLAEGESSPLGKQMLDSNYFHELGRFIDGVSSLGLVPTYLVTDKDESYSLYLRHDINNTNPKIIFKKDSNLEEILNNFSVAMGKKEFADEILNKYNRLLYIDLRFKNKVLYKFQ